MQCYLPLRNIGPSPLPIKYANVCCQPIKTYETVINGHEDLNFPARAKYSDSLRFLRETYQPAGLLS